MQHNAFNFAMALMFGAFAVFTFLCGVYNAVTPGVIFKIKTMALICFIVGVCGGISYYFYMLG